MSGYYPKTALSAAERRHMDGLVADLPTKSAKIRALHAAGYRRQQIASYLGIRYQHVRNVLTQHVPMTNIAAATEIDDSASAPVVADDTGEGAPAFGSLVVDEQGRIRLPEWLLRALDAKPGSSLAWHFEQGELRLMNRAAGIRYAQALVADLATRHPGNWTDAFIAERRAEAARE